MRATGSRMDGKRECFSIETNEDVDEYEDPSVDMYCNNSVRSDERDRRKKEIRKGEKKVLR